MSAYPQEKYGEEKGSKTESWATPVHRGGGVLGREEPTKETRKDEPEVLEAGQNCVLEARGGSRGRRNVQNTETRTEEPTCYTR